MKLLNEFHDGEELIDQQLLVMSVTKNINKNGKPYLDLQLKDVSTTRNAKKWEIMPGDEELFAVGNILSIDGKMILFNNSLQLYIQNARLVEKDDIDITSFVTYAPVKEEELIKDLKRYRSLIKDSGIKAIVDDIYSRYYDKFIYYPAASSIHHDYRNGLLYHSVSMLHHAEYFASYYGDLDTDLLYAGAMLHDLGKVVELEGDISFKYSLEGKLLGHISIGSAIVQEARERLNINSEKGILLQHLILSHHGQLEFGSPVPPLTKEALLLSIIDNVDSKMAILKKALDEVEPGSFTSKIFPLDGRLFYKPKK